MMGILRALAAHKIITAIVAATALGVGGTGVVIVSQPNCTNLRNCLSDIGLPAAPAPTSSTGAANNACPVPGSNPKFIAIFVQGIASYTLARSDQEPGTDDYAGAPIYSSGPAPEPGPNPTLGATEPPNHTQHFITGYQQIPAVGSFDAATTSYCATTPNEQSQNGGELPPNNSNIILRSMADGWLNYSYTNSGLGSLEPDASSDGLSRVMANDSDIINELADRGGYVLPFSYTGASMSGTAADPTFTLHAYDGSDVAVSDPMYVEPPKLNSELISINKVFPNVPIIIIGHSNGGLIAEQWWLRWGVPQGNSCSDPGGACGYHGVVHIWSLDSPINGVANAGLLNGVTCGVIQIVANCDTFVSPTVASAYAGLWNAAVTNPDPKDSDDNIESEDASDGGMYTAEGTYGDPLYDAGDIPDAAGDGILSQVMLSDPCLGDAGQPGLISTSECKPESNVLISPCDGTYLNTQPSSPQSPADVANGLNDGPPLFGMPGDVYIHSEAKDCPGTVKVIVNFIANYKPPATPPANALAAWNATDNGCATTMAASLRNVASLLPSSDATQIADLNQFAGLPLSELGEGTQQQQTEGQADLTALNKFFGTDRTLTTFTGPCSAAPSTPPPPTTPPTTLVSPGNESPADAVDGFYQSELAGDWAAVCSYVTPSAQSLCLAGTSGQGAATGTVHVGTMVIGPGNHEALVSVTGNICAPSSPCVSNTDPATGMPNSPSEFATDYQAAVASSTSDSSTSMSPMPCSQVNGQWYVDFG